MYLGMYHSLTSCHVPTPTGLSRGNVQLCMTETCCNKENVSQWVLPVAKPKCITVNRNLWQREEEQAAAVISNPSLDQLLTLTCSILSAILGAAQRNISKAT